MAAGVQGESVARNYAEALLALGRKAGDAPAWGALIRQVADAVDSNATLRQFLETPRIASDRKAAVLTAALGNRVPALFLRFLLQMVRNRRQMLIGAVASEYATLLDAAEGIVHARVTLAREAAGDEAGTIAARLSAVVGKTVVPHVTVDPSILGGVVVRIGDTVMDGSVRRRLSLLRRRMGTAPA